MVLISACKGNEDKSLVTGVWHKMSQMLIRNPKVGNNVQLLSILNTALFFLIMKVFFFRYRVKCLKIGVTLFIIATYL